MKIYTNRCEPKTYSCECLLKKYVNRCEPAENILWTHVNRRVKLCEPVRTVVRTNWKSASHFQNWHQKSAFDWQSIKYLFYICRCTNLENQILFIFVNFEAWPDFAHQMMNFKDFHQIPQIVRIFNPCSREMAPIHETYCTTQVVSKLFRYSWWPSGSIHHKRN